MDAGQRHGALFFRTDYDAYYANYTANNPIGFQFWEDDDGECVIRATSCATRFSNSTIT
jgi:hypothetical protein